MHDTAGYLTAAFTFLCAVILALIGFGMRAQIEALRNEFSSALGSAELRFFDLVNGKYVRKDILELRLAAFLCTNCANRTAQPK